MEKIDSMICDMKVNPGEDILPIGARSRWPKLGQALDVIIYSVKIGIFWELMSAIVIFMTKVVKIYQDSSIIAMATVTFSR